jgi:adenosylmethionine-8-amino-7-oxononanoate aminotransferase
VSTTGPTTRQWQFPQDVRRAYRTARRAESIRIWDTDGRQYIDADSGVISVISIGHGVAEVAEAMAAQAARLAYVHDGQFQHEPGDQVLVSPPPTVRRDDLDEIVDRLALGLEYLANYWPSTIDCRTS